MIARGWTRTTSASALAYGLNRDKQAEIIYRQHLAGRTAKEITQEFRVFQSQNHRCRRNMLSVVLSPTIADGRKMTRGDLREITGRFLSGMKLLEHQAVAIVHRDRAHLHLHLYINRIDFQGNAHPGDFFGKRCQWELGKVAREMGLVTVGEVQQKKLEALRDIRMEIKEIHDRVVVQGGTMGFEPYLRAMGEQGVRFLPSINKYNQLQGFRVEYKGHSLRGGEVHPSMSIGRIAQQLRFGRRVVDRAKREGTLDFMGKTVRVSPHLALGMTVMSAKRTMKFVIDRAKGVDIEI